ncbi:MAG: hypothetical protein U0797_13015 [Gemmataceae bacterium]
MPWPQGGLLIDSPGIRELQLWAEGADADAAFADISRLAEGCSFADCTHTHEPLRRPAGDRRRRVAGGATRVSSSSVKASLAYVRPALDGRAAPRSRKEQERRIHRVYKTTQKHNRRKGW